MSSAPLASPGLFHWRTIAVAVAVLSALLVELAALPRLTCGEETIPRDRVEQVARQATEYFRSHVAVRGGYVYYYSLDLQQRWGEGVASASQVWVQPPGTPTVGLAYLRAYEATSDRFFLQGAVAAAEALVYGQLRSGGWTNCIDFDPHGRVAEYRNGQGGGKNNSSLDDGQTPSALQLLIEVDAALDFEHVAIHEAAEFGLQALLAAQFPNGAFPQVWTGPVQPQQVVAASYPEYDWRLEHRVKNYWDMYTLNDNVCGYVADTLLVAAKVYGLPRYERALRKLGDFLILAQMPDPQPGWAQQYDYEMKPIWARKFEPPAIAGDETQEVIETLLRIFSVTGDNRYLQPLEPALEYLHNSLLPDGQLARFYELRSNRPLYMVRRGAVYSLAYDDTRVPGHYAWKIPSRLSQLTRRLQASRQGNSSQQHVGGEELQRQVLHVLSTFDSSGRWIDLYAGETLVGQPKFSKGFQYLSCATFAQNMNLLSDYLVATAQR